MIDVSQWRGSIGLWNYCQAASSRPANDCHFQAAVKSKSSKSSNITSAGKSSSQLSAALSFIVSLLLSLCNFIPPTGNKINMYSISYHVYF